MGFRERLRAVALSVPVPQSRRRRAAQAQDYWNASGGSRWAADAHVRGEVPGWDDIGRVHHEMFLTFARALEFDPMPPRVLEWGCGGGANAVAFAPEAQEFVGVDVSQELLERCGREIEAVCDTAYTPVLVGVDTPEDALRAVTQPVDLFLCLYVIELLPSQDHARRVMEVATRLLRPGGGALVQVKYQTSRFLTRPRTWSYRRQVAAMTSFPIHTFWEASVGWGFTPRLLTLVPRNELDERYAYFFLTRDQPA
jgi:SAM-dependent methyltransferase